jgi:hypothetical protein
LDIRFSGKWAVDPETNGISFEARVDGDPVKCRVNIEALQDIEPTNALSASDFQFRSNQFIFQEIAEALIRAGKAKDGQLFIKSSDVCG